MNDFLKNLRSSQKDQKQRQSGPDRKNIGTSFQTSTERRKLSDRRSTRQTQNQYKAADNISDTLPFITENMSQIAACAERFTESHEKLVQAEIEKNKAVEIFLQSLNTVLTEKFLPLFEEEKTAPPRGTGTVLSDGNESNTRQTKEDVIATIKNMRKNRATFAEIAMFLKEQGIPTFSGRGEWHAQTIHRLCK
ncbi:MAG: hypothetical protein U9P10_09635 [Thermodesulfobacteriota bacterium]|nr:hypothetical protein [Thermodesulfobacteriota bacterium]